MISVAIIHLFGEKKNNTRYRKSIQAEDQFFKYFSFSLHGLKELKLNKDKNDDLFFNHTEKSAIVAKKLRTEVNVKFLRNTLLGQFFFFGIIALFLFVMPFFKISLLTNSAQYILITLYIMSPAQTIAQFIPDFLQASIGLDRFRELEKLEQVKEKDDAKRNVPFPGQFFSIGFKNVAFNYEVQHDEKGFEIGPLNFNFNKGEVIFLSGGNGSGKSTFIRLLTGLYSPSVGSVLINNKELLPEQGEAYRSLFSVVFTDNYLFDKVFGLKKNMDEQMNKILQEIGLDSKVNFVDHTFSTIDLSYGQRKRLSLATCLLEDNEIYVFDEIAANQDPEFKKYFYHRVLSDLRDKGKVVLVVTHDENYFHLADRHYKMEMGKIFKFKE
jgi:putative ATP-binding cassette transporter